MYLSNINLYLSIYLSIYSSTYVCINGSLKKLTYLRESSYVYDFFKYSFTVIQIMPQNSTLQFFN